MRSHDTSGWGGGVTTEGVGALWGRRLYGEQDLQCAGAVRAVRQLLGGLRNDAPQLR